MVEEILTRNQSNGVAGTILLWLVLLLGIWVLDSQEGSLGHVNQ